LIILGRRGIKGLGKYGQENRISGKLSIPKKPIPISIEYCLVRNLTRDKVVEIKDSVGLISS
jgi:hypothetical protein